MINLASRDILHSWGKFIFTGMGLGLLIGVTLVMAGVYREWREKHPAGPVFWWRGGISRAVTTKRLRISQQACSWAIR